MVKVVEFAPSKLGTAARAGYAAFKGSQQQRQAEKAVSTQTPKLAKKLYNSFIDYAGKQSDYDPKNKIVMKKHFQNWAENVLKKFWDKKSFPKSYDANKLGEFMTGVAKSYLEKKIKVKQ